MPVRFQHNQNQNSFYFITFSFRLQNHIAYPQFVVFALLVSNRVFSDKHLKKNKFKKLSLAISSRTLA
jgi:hypothetical protein